MKELQGGMLSVFLLGFLQIISGIQIVSICSEAEKKMILKGC